MLGVHLNPLLYQLSGEEEKSKIKEDQNKMNMKKQMWGHTHPISYDCLFLLINYGQWIAESWFYALCNSLDRCVDGRNIK